MTWPWLSEYRARRRRRSAILRVDGSGPPPVALPLAARWDAPPSPAPAADPDADRPWTGVTDAEGRPDLLLTAIAVMRALEEAERTTNGGRKTFAGHTEVTATAVLDLTILMRSLKEHAVGGSADVAELRGARLARQVVMESMTIARGLADPASKPGPVAVAPLPREDEPTDISDHRRRSEALARRLEARGSELVAVSAKLATVLTTVRTAVSELEDETDRLAATTELDPAGPSAPVVPLRPQAPTYDEAEHPELRRPGGGLG